MTKNYIEIQGYTTRARFVAICKKLMVERGYGEWVECFEGMLEEADEIRKGKRAAYHNSSWERTCGMTCKEIHGHDFNEENANDGYDFKTYYKHDTDGSAYNMTFEHDGEHGYFYMIDTAIVNAEIKAVAS